MDDDSVAVVGAAGMSAPVLNAILTFHKFLSPVLRRQRHRPRRKIFFKLRSVQLRTDPGQQRLSVISQAARLDMADHGGLFSGKADDVAILRDQGALDSAGPRQS